MTWQGCSRSDYETIRLFFASTLLLLLEFHLTVKCHGRDIAFQLKIVIIQSSFQSFVKELVVYK